jgi:hypothetical protein
MITGSDDYLITDISNIFPSLAGHCSFECKAGCWVLCGHGEDAEAKQTAYCFDACRSLYELLIINMEIIIQLQEE